MKHAFIMGFALFTVACVNAQSKKPQTNQNTVTTSPYHPQVNTDDGYKKWNSTQDKTSKDVLTGRKTVEGAKKEYEKAPAQWKDRRSGAMRAN